MKQSEMGKTFLALYKKIILDRPLATLVVTLLVITCFIFQIPKFKLDASAESLVLEKDTALRYHRQISERYSTNEVLVLTYSPKADLFSKKSLDSLKKLRDTLRALDGVQSVITLLDVPILYSTGLSLGDLTKEDAIKTIEQVDVDLKEVRKEFLENPLYANRLMSSDGQTSTILVNLPIDSKYRELLKIRYQLREKKYEKTISSAEVIELEKVSEEFRQYLAQVNQQQKILVQKIRITVEPYKKDAVVYLGGVPMIVSDMIDFVGNDLIVFGIGVFLFLLITLAVIFRKKRWVFLPMVCCFAAGLTMIGYLGFADWRVTVISSNFISLMLIFTMSLTIHLIVRYREIHQQQPDSDHKALVLETVRLKFVPCFYTTLTTIVAFASLLVSDIRPVMDFGLMMTIGLIVSFVLSFILFPVGLMFVEKSGVVIKKQTQQPFTLVFARLTKAHGTKILFFSIFLTIISGIGISKLKVENRFIDYFRSRTEIYQGMKLIDQKLGGTTPFDLIIDFDEQEEDTESFEEDDLFADFSSNDEPISWYSSTYRMEQIEKIHDFLLDLPEIGEVLSIATGMKVARRLNKDVPLDNYEIALIHKKIPADLKQMLIDPYISQDIPQARIAMRAMETDKELQRKVLLSKIEDFMTQEMGFRPEQFHFTNMFILYNNLLQSLFRSQILTIGMVFLGIMVMFMILFRSFSIAILAILPNLLPAAMVLGVMGWVGIPLDMMTITIAAITIGIAVDDTIHYIHRYKKEFFKDKNYQAAMFRCHESIGRAMYYTSLTIVIGFSILVSSNFVPTVYFGLFTGFAMLVALLAALTLLPQLLMIFKPFGPE